MTDLELSRLMTVAASVTITVGLWHQAIKLVKTKSVGDLAWTVVLALAFNELAWLKYGIVLREWPIILISGLNLPAVFVISCVFFRYWKRTGGS